MKKDVKVEFLKEKNLDACIELIKEKGKFNILSEYANFYDRRTYFKVNENGDIFQKTYNPITLLYLFCDDEKKLADYLFKYSYAEEKQNIKKIDKENFDKIENELEIKFPENDIKYLKVFGYILHPNQNIAILIKNLKKFYQNAWRIFLTLMLLIIQNLKGNCFQYISINF